MYEGLDAIWQDAPWQDAIWQEARTADGYLLFRGVGSAGAIDYGSPVAFADAGEATLDTPAAVSHVDGTVYWYGLRAVSAAGIVETNTHRLARVIVAAGALLGPPPAAMNAAFCRAEAVAVGRVRLTLAYDGRDAAGRATGVEVARLVDGDVDWGEPLQTLPIVAATGGRRVTLDGAFADGELVRLAVRAVTADGVGGVAATLNPVVSDASGPTPVGYVAGRLL